MSTVIVDSASLIDPGEVDMWVAAIQHYAQTQGVSLSAAYSYYLTNQTDPSDPTDQTVANIKAAWAKLLSPASLTRGIVIAAVVAAGVLYLATR